MTADDALKTQVKEMLVRQLKLQVQPAEIKDEEPLFGDEGLGLDSIDVLEAGQVSQATRSPAAPRPSGPTCPGGPGLVCREAWSA